MAKVTIAGNSYVVTSDIAMTDLETVKKYRPTVLAITDPETKEELFKIGISSGNDSLSEHGISFGGVTNDEKRLATATLTIPSDLPDDADAKSYVLDKAGTAIANLNKVEKNITESLKDIKSEHETIAANIKVIV